MALKHVKLAGFRASERLGFSRLLLDSEWRRQRLLILCYHGISIEDEHEWDPTLYMRAERLRERFAHLRETRCAVLPLEEALDRLRDGRLPPRAVTVTFDDGCYDFSLRALPVIREFDIPVTLYFSTYYSYFNRPIFDLAIDYVLWKARSRTLTIPSVLGRTTTLDADGRRRATKRFRAHAHERDLTPEDKDDLLRRVATTMGVDYDAICRQRILHVMTPDEASAAARAGVDIQLHTHRHRVYVEQWRFQEGIDENRRHLEPIAPGRRDHFCYPGGMHRPEFLPWLALSGVRSATTCQAGMASRRTAPLLLPRLLDTDTLTTTEFSAWISGLASFLPQRAYTAPEWMLVRSQKQQGREAVKAVKNTLT
jgi:peptidoglycan/xylan/chitin deacetylase (PgdA/CDA1 family)